MLEGIAAAVITALAAVAVAIYQGRATRRQNTAEHAEGRALLRDAVAGIDRVETTLGQVRHDLDAHLEHHRENE